ncbi:LacI family DNA-binding transcriptional regulator [Chryseobacterium gleum]|uniref:LacI family DNA-binding transcriptional regulator n=1 Tax=Chryseobacterium gleum TaxID=250 RepID=UPI0028ADB1B9|nr:LacI family DNA-binding transcriptional regulator [Chryseobacterium gleum]
MKRITIKDLAKHLRLSTSTISRAFVNDKNIHPETKKLILEAAEKLGYKPNSTALNLKYGRSMNIGFIVPEMTTPFSASVLKGAREFLDPLGYSIIIMQSEEDPEVERKNLSLLEEFNVDGIIANLCHQTENNTIFQKIITEGIPLVFFDRIPDESLDASKVIINDNIKSALMVEHLFTTGKRRIVHLMGPDNIRNSKERALGYQRIMDKYGISDSKLLIKSSGLLFTDGRKAAKELLDKNIEFDSIFAFTDTLAIGAMNYLLENNITVPDTVSIASFSGTELATMVYPQVSTVQQPLFQMGQLAAKLIVDKIKNPADSSKTISLDAELVYRSSTLGLSNS